MPYYLSKEHIKIYIEMSLLRVSFFDNHQGACTEPA